MKPTILIIENDKPSLTLYQRELSAYFNILPCDNQSLAFQFLQNHDVAAIVIEPAGNNSWAWSFLESIKQDPLKKIIPVIICSILDERKKAIEMGASASLTKPVYANDLRKFIQSTIYPIHKF